MTGRLLDVTTMPFDQVYTCEDGFEINLREFLAQYEDVVDVLAAKGLVKDKDSFGFAMMAPLENGIDIEDDDFWDKPEDFVYFVGGWGPDRNRYIANAIRKIRPLFRYGMQYTSEMGSEFLGTLEFRFFKPNLFEDTVGQINEDGTFPWGDFPCGGAVALPFEERGLVGAVSALSEVEDDIVAKLILGGISRLIIEHDKLLSDD